MKKLTCLLAATLFLLAGTAAAQYSLKWEQPPNCTDGFNVESYTDGVEWVIIADDFKCNDIRPITRVRFWGSFENWMDDFPGPDTPIPDPAFFPENFEISWHTYTHPEGEYSMPEEPIRVDICYLIDDPVWWCSHPVWNKPTFFEHEYYFDVYLDAEPFPQLEGQYYFINIVANYDSAYPVYPWGWKNSESQWNDDAVRSYDGGGTWDELTWPEGHRLEGFSMDMAFELYVATSPIPTPTPSPTLTPVDYQTPIPTRTVPPTPIPPPTSTPTPRPSMTMTPPPGTPTVPTLTPPPTATPTLTPVGYKTPVPTPTVPPTPPPTVPPSPVPTCSVSCDFRVSGSVLEEVTFSPLSGAALTMTSPTLYSIPP